MLDGMLPVEATDELADEEVATELELLLPLYVG